MKHLQQMNTPHEHSILSVEYTAVDTATKLGCAALWERVWPSALGPSLTKRLERIEVNHDALSGHQWHIGTCNSDVRSVARTFRKTVSVGGRDIDILALASVCSDPDQRGEGWGDAVVRAAFRRADNEGLIILFQTSVADFYQRHGARCIANPVVSSVAGTAPFDDEHVMVYAPNVTWPEEATIDLYGNAW